VIEGWHDLFVMLGGAAAALAGLIFVAVSVNHERILDGSSLPNFAVRVLTLLIGVVIVCAFGLAPQPAWVFGAEVLVAGVALAAIHLGTSIPQIAGVKVVWGLQTLGLAVLATAPGIVAGALLLAGSGAGMYWLLAEFVAAIGVASWGAWVLLIEIRR
jgi:hypothetical protein